MSNYNCSLLQLARDFKLLKHISRVGNRPGRPTGAYGLAYLKPGLAWPVYKKASFKLFLKPI
jgi:hypothetical protein